MNVHHLARLALCSTLLLSQLGYAAVDTVDRIVAVVNRGVITAQELDARVESIKGNLQSQKIAAPPQDVLRQQVLERMITEQVQLQYAAIVGIRIDDNQLERAVARIAEQNKLSVPAFRQELGKQGIAWSTFREEIRNEITLSRLKQREIDAKIVVTDSEIDEAFKLAEGKQQVEYELAHILISLPENASAEVIAQKRARINAARDEINAGKDFGAVAAVYSNAQDATKGGQLGWRAAGSLPPAIAGLLSQLKQGEITDVIRSPAGFHLMKLLDKRSKNEQEIVEQNHTRHILVKVNEIVSDDDAKQKIGQLRDRILRGAKFEDVAKAFSEDGSAAKGGDLGWVNPGETVPEFEQAMNALKPGELSQPVRSPFGYHLITVLERRKQDVTQERARYRVGMEIRQRKTEEQYDDWVRQLRDKAFVNIRLKDQ